MEEKKQELKEWQLSYKKGYTDPDGIHHTGYEMYKYCYNNENFYREYVAVLQNKNPQFTIYFDGNDETYKKPGLKFKGKRKEAYYLKSDQFGFSRPGGEGKYPYELYLEKVLDDDLENRKNYLPEAKEKVREWMRVTRQVGGSFFWPMQENKSGGYYLRYTPKYNLERGINSYIQDRVDLTLFEIYEYYKFKEGKSIDKGNKLIENAESSNEMKSWLNEFKDFEEYVDFFALNPFVDEEYENEEGKKVYIPLNLLTGKAFDKKIERVPRIDSKMTIKEYERLFNRITKKIKERRIKLGLEKDNTM